MFIKIVFGTSSFKLKSFAPIDVGIFDKDIGDNPIEVRQKYFHLFYIPVFSLGKIYAYRIGDDLYNLSEEHINLIKAKKRIRTPFYTYSAIIIPLLFVLFDFAKYELNRMSVDDYYSLEHKNQTELNLKLIEELDTNDYIKLLPALYPDRDDGMYAKVHQVENGSIVIQKLHTQLFSYTGPVIPHKLKSFYIKNRETLKPHTISLTDLKAAICMTYDSLTNGLCTGTDFFGDGDFYVIEYIERIDNGPILKNGNVNATGGGIRIFLSNFGHECDLIKIENVVGVIKWDETLPMFLETDDSNPGFGDSGFSLNGENYLEEDYSIVLHLKTPDGKMYKYSVIGNQLDFKVLRVN